MVHVFSIFILKTMEINDPRVIPIWIWCSHNPCESHYINMGRIWISIGVLQANIGIASHWMGILRLSLCLRFDP